MSSFKTDTTRWRAVQTRDPTATTAFIYAVKSTHIFCRPTCPARLARRANISFFDTASLALKAGFRPCKRCKPDQDRVADRGGTQREKAVRRACEYVEERGGKVTLAEAAEVVGLSSRYFHEVFKTAMGETLGAYAGRIAARRQKVRGLDVQGRKQGEMAGGVTQLAPTGDGERVKEMDPAVVPALPDDLFAYVSGGDFDVRLDQHGGATVAPAALVLGEPLDPAVLAQDLSPAYTAPSRISMDEWFGMGVDLSQILPPLDGDPPSYEEACGLGAIVVEDPFTAAFANASVTEHVSSDSQLQDTRSPILSLV